ncbi:hypothetical protein BJ508DRAFT_376237, partial [Ascobolus immersus RN42]
MDAPTQENDELYQFFTALKTLGPKDLNHWDLGSGWEWLEIANRVRKSLNNLYGEWADSSEPVPQPLFATMHAHVDFFLKHLDPYLRRSLDTQNATNQKTNEDSENFELIQIIASLYLGVVDGHAERREYILSRHRAGLMRGHYAEIVRQTCEGLWKQLQVIMENDPDTSIAESSNLRRIFTACQRTYNIFYMLLYDERFRSERLEVLI